jgi:hypothetical protein
MQKLNKCQERTIMVLHRLIDIVTDNEDDAEVLSDELGLMIACLAQEDFFGTEGQCDPRGDFRVNDWSMQKVQGVDGE